MARSAARHRQDAPPQATEDELRAELDRLAEQSGLTGTVRLRVERARSMSHIRRQADGTYLVTIHPLVLTAPAGIRSFLLAHELGHPAVGDPAVSTLPMVQRIPRRRLVLASALLVAFLAALGVATVSHGLTGGLLGLALAPLLAAFAAASTNHRQAIELAADRHAARLGHPFGPDVLDWLRRHFPHGELRHLHALSSHPSYHQRLRAAQETP